MFNRFLAIIILAGAIVASAAVAEPVIVSYESGEKVTVVLGADFGSRGLLSDAAGFLERSKLAPRSVVLGDAAEIDGCDRLYGLRTMEWSDSKVTVEFVIPEEMRGGALYLYVLDDEGNASLGFAMTPGQPGPPQPSSQPDAPGAPGKPVYKF